MLQFAGGGGGGKWRILGLSGVGEMAYFRAEWGRGNGVF